MLRREGIINVFESMIIVVVDGGNKELYMETVFKEYWHCQLIIEKKQRQKCIRCPFFCFCFPDFGVCFDEGYKFNKRAIEGFCRDKELKGTIRRLNKIIETEGHQSHDWSDPLKNKWYEEMKKAT